MIDLTANIEIIDDRHRTHMDLFYMGAKVSDEALITECVLIDISKSPQQIDFINLEELKNLKKGNSVILKTGWEKYRGTQEYDESPWIDKKLIEHIVSLGAVLVLVDSPGVYGGAAGPEHNAMDQFLADSRANAVENLVNLDLIPSSKFALYCFPIYSTKSNAAPCRVIAKINI